MIRTGFVVTALLASGAAPAATLVIRAGEIGSTDGMVYAGICDRSFDEETCPYRDRVAARPGRVELRVRNVKPGRYAIAVFHDTNGNGKLDRNFIGLPQEPYGFANDVGRRGFPSFEGAPVTVSDPITTIVVPVRTVALEPAPCPAAIGERHVREAGLDDRIDIRRQRVETMTDHRAFDLAFLPQMFLPDAIMDATLRGVFRALKPGGWLLVAVLARPGPDVAAGVARLKNILWGGNARVSDALKPLIEGAGFSPVIRAPGGESIRMICARRPARLKRGRPCLE